MAQRIIIAVGCSIVIAGLLYRSIKIEKEMGSGEGYMGRFIYIPKFLCFILRAKPQKIPLPVLVYKIFSSFFYLTVPTDIIFIVLTLINPIENLNKGIMNAFFRIGEIGVLIFMVGFILLLLISKYDNRENRVIKTYNRFNWKALKIYWFINALILVSITIMFIIGKEAFYIIIIILACYFLILFLLPYYGSKTVVCKDFFRYTGKIIYFDFIYKIENKRKNNITIENAIDVTLKDDNIYTIRTVSIMELVMDIINKNPKVINCIDMEKNKSQ